MNSGIFNNYSMGYVPHNAVLDTAMKIVYTYYGYSEQQIINLLESHYQPVNADQLTLNPHGFVNRGVDQIQITAPMSNPGNHNVELYSLIESVDGSFQDSLQMFDDGMHGDVAAGDGIFGNSYLAPTNEQEFMVGLKTIDLDFSVTIIHEDIDRFTTVGPVKVNDCIEMLKVANKIYYQL